MNRAVVHDLIPAMIALATSFVVLWAIVRFSGAKLSIKRLSRLHCCQAGSVQSLSFVLTLPLFIMIVMLVVQISQLMIGIMGVHYAAFAAARAAQVWTPARIENSSWGNEDENMLPMPLAEDTPLNLLFDGQGVSHSGQNLGPESAKLERIFTAAASATAIISPSRPHVASTREPWAVQELYRSLVPESQTNSKIPERLRNKFSYAWWNTRVELAFLDKDTREGPTYNPRVLVIVDGMPVEIGEYEWLRDWNPNEVGWEDPIGIRVVHDFALLPGPGRFLAKYIVRADGRADQVSPRIETHDSTDRVPWTRRTYTTEISAFVTLTNEGLKPVLPYAQDIQ